MVSFTAFITLAALCASIANAAPLPGKGAQKAVSTSCSTSATAKPKPTTTSCTTTKSKSKTKTKNKAKPTTTSCSTTKAKAKPTMKPKPKKMTTTTSCSTSSSTSSAALTYSTPSYGSGMSNWNKGKNYNDCVQQCIVKNGGMKMGSYMKPTATKSMGSKGTGATHTVIVAPSQGVLRYVPMAVNASVGDTIKFVWGANNHTVTKGSQLEPCNKTKDALFTSGSQNKGFVFTQVVNDTKPTFFFCNTPGHCQKGMFGIINPKNNFGSPSCAKKMMPEMMKNSSTLASMDAYMNMMKSKTKAALNWGNNLDMDAIPSWAQESMGENIMFTRSFLAANPDVMDKSGKVDLGQVGDAPFVVPKDLGSAPRVFAATAHLEKNLPVVIASSSSASPVVQLVTATAPVPLSSAAPSASATPKKSSGAFTIRSQAGVVGVVATIATYLIM